ncbi:MAG: hypothetical protein IBX63_06440 [Coriobacteriia bacterium]|nr:hypothetical protein [Coriobacteriia bacterium]
MPTTVEELTALGPKAKIHHLDVLMLVCWTRDTIGDTELAASLETIVGSQRPYGLLVPEIKQAIAKRLEQYHTVLDDESEKKTA